MENSINTDNKQVNFSAVRSAHMVPSGDVCSASVIHPSATEAFTVQDRVDTVEKKCDQCSNITLVCVDENENRK